MGHQLNRPPMPGQPPLPGQQQGYPTTGPPTTGLSMNPPTSMMAPMQQPGMMPPSFPGAPQVSFRVSVNSD